MYNTIIAKARQYALELLSVRLSGKFVFHNVSHTKEVAEAALLIGKKSCLSIEDMFIVEVAAYFHDTGFIYKYDNHEMESTKIVQDFLADKNIDCRTIEKITASILSTKIPQKPRSETGKVLCDADLYHLSQPYFFNKTYLIKKEWELRSNCIIDEKKYLLDTLTLFTNHCYHTEYGKSVLTNGKLHNRKILEQKIRKLQKA